MATKGGARGALPGSILLVIHDFAARGPDELTLAKGDRIELIERDDEFGDGWFLGRHLANGQSGLFPEVYTTPAPKPTLPAAVRPPRAVEPQPSISSSPVTTSPSTSLLQQQSPTTTSSSISRSSGLGNNQSPLIQTGLRTKGDTGRSSIGTRNISMNSDSPVMSETLSVIDEHITDMHTPRSSYSTPNKRESVSSMYSSHPLSRRSYIAGAETDEEEQQLYTEAEVHAWSPIRVAEYLEDIGVERAHCDVFVEQDISGEVLLAMDQNSLFIKEFELGSVGRRLKTWHRIKALQDEVRRASLPAPAPPPVPPLPDLSTLQPQSPAEEKEREVSRMRSSTVGTASPAGLVADRPSPPVALGRTKTPSFSFWSAPTMSIAANNSTLAAQAPTSRTDSSRPSAQNVRNLNHARRHSSMDSTSTDGTNLLPAHRRQPSTDQRSVSSITGKVSGHNHTTSVDSHANAGGSFLATGSPSDLDRGYFSSTEVESRNRKTLVKRTPSGAANASSSHVRSHSTSRSAKGSISSVPNIHEEGGAEDVAPTQGARGAINGAFESLRIATVSQFAKKTQESPVTPASAPARESLIRTVSKTTSVGSPRGAESDGGSDISALPPVEKSGGDSAATGSSGLYSSINNKFEALRSAVGSKRTSDSNTMNRAPSGAAATVASVKESEGEGSVVKTVGIPYQNTASMEGTRSVSEAITKQEKAKDSSLNSPSWTGISSTVGGTPATTDKDADSARASTGSGGAIIPVPPPSTKRARGATTKNDTSEKGLIDISFHRVLPAHNETLVGLHATVTGAASSAAPSPALEQLSPTRAAHSTSASATASPTALTSTTTTAAAADDDDSGLFIFKLLPPKTGLAKGVNFTKPTVHYFALPSRSAGRLWMAALMKATIDRDPGATVTTTYNQKTISLAKARARKERPDALRDFHHAEDAASIGTAASERTRDSTGYAAAATGTEDGREGESHR
ncbi:uncharacterized protein K489DRAFT_148242 [Dissoconium aciculare CBS 342.82]|uniref:SH3 domain-containing protein n=1 Tax=Dissoconium aciculare CBS 342.82 TaxID=1314786 RepID=A0A6J3MBR8_9PEZI|nr:uncharacterized protein K489DRAFT_148242 [Dissoconium aciculare CBS 342.82]KAF1825069.1 hypothetical protein K489DRAFT_148242 [Dissoconium aciculare CBS 342.82]